MAAQKKRKKSSQKRSAKRSQGKNKVQTLTIEFAGICALVTSERDPSKAQVWLVNVPAAIPRGAPGRAPHCATLVAPVLEQQRPKADRAIAVPGRAEYAIWDLSGMEVAFSVDGRPPADLKIAVGKNLPNIGTLASKKVEPELHAHIPISTRVKITGGRLSAPTPSVNQAPVEFLEDLELESSEKRSKVVARAQRYSNRFKLRLKFHGSATIKFKKPGKRQATLEFEQTTTVVVGNVCQEMRQEPRHFDAFYGLLAARQGPRIHGRDGGGAFITPEFCIPAMLRRKNAIPSVAPRG